MKTVNIRHTDDALVTQIPLFVPVQFEFDFPGIGAEEVVNIMRAQAISGLFLDKPPVIPYLFTHDRKLHQWKRRKRPDINKDQ